MTPTSRRLWHVWTGPCRPATAQEEAVFSGWLREHPRRDWDRDDLTLVLNALRAALDPDQMLSCTPGADPARLRGAYEHLDARRALASDAWDDWVGGADSRALLLTAAPLLPVPIGRVLQSPDRKAAQGVLDRVERTTASARTVEDALASKDPEISASAGQRLYNPYSACWWDDPYYRPSRITDLVPLRVRALLSQRS